MFQKLFYITKIMDSFPETIITIALLVIAGPLYDALAFVVLFLAAFFWTIRIRREIQQQFHNKIMEAIKSIFRKRTQYGPDKEEKSSGQP